MTSPARKIKREAAREEKTVLNLTIEQRQQIILVAQGAAYPEGRGTDIRSARKMALLKKALKGDAADLRAMELAEDYEMERLAYQVDAQAWLEKRKASVTAGVKFSEKRPPQPEPLNADIEPEDFSLRASLVDWLKEAFESSKNLPGSPDALVHIASQLECDIDDGLEDEDFDIDDDEADDLVDLTEEEVAAAAAEVATTEETPAEVDPTDESGDGAIDETDKKDDKKDGDG